MIIHNIQHFVRFKLDSSDHMIRKIDIQTNESSSITQIIQNQLIMMTGINICVIGEVSSGKTSLVSVLINQLAGIIRMKRSTMNYTRFVENPTEIIRDSKTPTDDHRQMIRCDTVQINPIKCLNYERSYRFNLYDSVGMNERDSESLHFFKSSILPYMDILLIVLDVTSTLSKKSEEDFLKMTMEYKCHRIYIINRVDDPTDDEIIENIDFMTNYLLTNKYIDHQDDIVICSSKNMFDIMFKTKYYVQLEQQYKESDQSIEHIILNKFGLTELSLRIKNITLTNLTTIYQKKLNIALSMNTSTLTDMYRLYKQASEVDPNIMPIETYFRSIDYLRATFDTNIKTWIDDIESNVRHIILSEYATCVGGWDKTEYMIVSTIFGNSSTVIGLLLQFYNDSENQELFFNLIKNDVIYSIPTVKIIIDLMIERYIGNLVQDDLKTDQPCLVPSELKTYESYKIAIIQGEYKLCDVPNEFKTTELCEIAIEKNTDAFLYVPEGLKTFIWYETAINRCNYPLKDVPYEFKTIELCETAVCRNGGMLEYVPNKFKTKELCEIAVGRDKRTLQYIPDKLKTNELCEIAVRQDGMTLRYVPNKLKTNELCEIAVTQNKYALIYVPDKLKTVKLCKRSASCDMSAIKYGCGEVSNNNVANKISNKSCDPPIIQKIKNCLLISSNTMIYICYHPSILSVIKILGIILMLVYMICYMICVPPMRVIWRSMSISNTLISASMICVYLNSTWSLILNIIILIYLCIIAIIAIRDNHLISYQFECAKRDTMRTIF